MGNLRGWRCKAEMAIFLGWKFRCKMYTDSVASLNFRVIVPQKLTIFYIMVSMLRFDDSMYLRTWSLSNSTR